MSDTFGCQAAPDSEPAVWAHLCRDRCVNAQPTVSESGHASSMRRAAEQRDPEDAEPRHRWRKLPVLAVAAARSRPSGSPQSGTRRRAMRPETRGPCGASRAAARDVPRAIWELRRIARTARSANSVLCSRANSRRSSTRSRQPRSSASNESRDRRASQPRGRRASRDPAAERP